MAGGRTDPSQENQNGELPQGHRQTRTKKMVMVRGRSLAFYQSRDKESSQREARRCQGEAGEQSVVFILFKPFDLSIDCA